MNQTIFVNHVMVISQPKEGKKAGVMFEYMNIEAPSEGMADGFPVVRGWMDIDKAKKFKGVGFYNATFKMTPFAGQLQARITDVEFQVAGTFAEAK